MVWGSNGGFKSCDSILSRVENDESKLKELVILPMKTFGKEEVERLAKILMSGKNHNLKSISASGHSVPSSALAKLGAALKSHNGINHIAIGDENMGDEGVISFCSELKDVNGGTLETLDLTFKSISKEGAKIIGEVFASSENLKSLLLYRNPAIGDDGLTIFSNAALAASPNPFTSLQHLDLSDCNISSKGVESLVECLIGHTTTDRFRSINLTLNSNPLGSSSCDSLVRLISESKEECCMLKSLSLKNCSIGTGLEMIAEAMVEHKCTGLELLDLSNNRIESVSALKFAASLEQGKHNINELKEIRLAENNIGEEAVIAIANSLEQLPGKKGGNSSVTVLDISNTDCGVSGAIVLMKCTSLLSLRLFNNKLGTAGFDAISAYLIGGHPNLQHLDLGGNRAEGKAVSQLLRNILTEQECYKSSLQTLELGGNENDDEALFEEARRKRPDLDIVRDREAVADEWDEVS